MTDPVAWLLAQIDADRAAADRTLDEMIGVSFTIDDSDSAWHAHTLRWQPSRVLRECEAKRRIVEEHHQAGDDSWSPYRGRCAVCGEFQDWPCTTVKLLALPYVSQRADFPEELRL